MLSRLLIKNNKCMRSGMRSFAAINTTNINLSSINPADVHDSSAPAVGSVMAALAAQKEAHHDLCHEIDEFWRQNFRKVSFEDAKDVVNNLGKDINYNLIEGLDDKFWVWETLEEATRPHIDSLDKDESRQFLYAWVN